MARNMAPRFKQCRRLGVNVCGHPKAMKRANAPAFAKRKKPTEYSKQLTEKQIDEYVNTYIKKADLNLVTGVVDGNAGNKLVAFGVSFPSFTDALREIGDGKLFPTGWLKVLKVLKWHKTDTVDLLLIGVLPEYRKKGANALIFADLIEQYRRYGFKWAEAMPQMETNTGVQSQWQYLESEQHRRHRCYKKKI